MGSFVFDPSTSSPEVRLTDIHVAPPKAKGQKMALGDFLQDKGMRPSTWQSKSCPISDV